MRQHRQELDQPNKPGHGFSKFGIWMRKKMEKNSLDLKGIAEGKNIQSDTFQLFASLIAHNSLTHTIKEYVHSVLNLDFLIFKRHDNRTSLMYTYPVIVPDLGDYGSSKSSSWIHASASTVNEVRQNKRFCFLGNIFK